MLYVIPVYYVRISLVITDLQQHFYGIIWQQQGLLNQCHIGGYIEYFQFFIIKKLYLYILLY